MTLAARCMQSRADLLCVCVDKVEVIFIYAESTCAATWQLLKLCIKALCYINNY
jgi:hypothetical protein